MQKFVGKFNKVKNKIRRNDVIESIISTPLRTNFYINQQNEPYKR